MKKEMSELREDEATWVNALTTHFNIKYNKSRWYEGAVSHLLRLYGCKYEKEVRCLVTNSVRAVKHRAIGLKIPRSKRYFTGNPQGVSNTRMMRLLDNMEEDGWVDLYIGGVKTWVNGSPDQVDQSVTTLKDKFILLLRGVDMGKVLCKNAVEEVELNERGTKKALSTQGMKGVKELRKTVLEFNSALVESRISLKGITLPNQHYKRVFIDNLETGGRWYNSTGGIQTMDRTLRPFLRIDGEELVELDYSSIHASILYEQLSGEVPESFEPYGVDLFDTYFDAVAVEHFKKTHGLPNYRPDRNLIKMMVMIGLNAKNKGGSVRAISQKVGQDRKKWGKPEEHKCEFFGLVGEDYNEIYDKILEHNHLIADKFFSDQGVHLQKIDSDILESIICDLLAQGEICLPWHDGLMVKKRHSDLVKESMYRAWYKKLGSVKFCKVEEK